MKLTDATILTAMVTPFNEKNDVDYTKLPKLIDYLLDTHTEGLVVAGTTGESPTLTQKEMVKLFEETVKVVAGRVPVICGVGSNSTQETVDFIQEVANIKGVVAGLCVVPYYNKPSQEGLYQHFKTIAEASDLPIILYNVPSRTAANMEVETTLRLAQLPNVIGVKECSGLDAISLLVEKAPKDFLVYTGEDGLAYATKAVGGKGIISVVSHVAGNDIYEMYKCLNEGKVAEAAAFHRQLVPKIHAVFSAPSPAPIKAILNHRKVPVGSVRLPIVACTPQETKKILMITES